MSSWLSFNARTASQRFRCKTNADRHNRPFPHSSGQSALPKVNIALTRGILPPTGKIAYPNSGK
jgi:hypothetical protein